MSAYLDNMINNPEEYAIDYAGNALEILVSALKWQNASLKNFETSQEADNKDTANTFWEMSMEADKRADGLLDAYEILTMRKIINTRWSIYEEITWLATSYDLDDFIPSIDILPKFN